MPSSQWFSTLSMASCRAAITLTQSRAHSNAWICSGGSRFPTTTPPQPPSAKHAVLLFPHPPPRPHRHLVSPRSHPLSVTCRISSESKRQPAYETRNKKGTRNDKETRIQTKTRPKNPLYPTFHQSLLHSYSVPFTVGADSPKSRLPRSYLRPGLTRRCSQFSSSAAISSRCNETVLTILRCGIHPVSSAPAI